MKAFQNTPKPRMVRRTVVAAVLAVIAIGIASRSDIGTLCSWCPFGFAQASLASRELQTAIIAPLIAVIVIAGLFGRAFCAWACPSGFVKKTRQPAAKDRQSKGVAGSAVIVAGVLALSFIVGFPVFCLFCPIGLVFGFMFALFRSLTIYQPSWDLVVFPIMLLIELRLFGPWCSRICPLGAAAGLIARISPFNLRVRANERTCYTDTSCGACSQACPENIDPRADPAISDEACTLCLECRTVCPSRSLSLTASHHPAAKEDPADE